MKKYSYSEVFKLKNIKPQNDTLELHEAIKQQKIGDSLKKSEARKLISQMAKVLGHLGGSAKRNRSHESWVAMARAGGLARAKKIREQKARLSQ